MADTRKSQRATVFYVRDELTGLSQLDYRLDGDFLPHHARPLGTIVVDDRGRLIELMTQPLSGMFEAHQLLGVLDAARVRLAFPFSREAAILAEMQRNHSYRWRNPAVTGFPPEGSMFPDDSDEAKLWWLCHSMEQTTYHHLPTMYDLRQQWETRSEKKIVTGSRSAMLRM